MLQNRLFFALASRSGFGAAVSDAVARNSVVFCNSVTADRIVVAASRLLDAAAACAILLSFAAEDLKQCSHLRGLLVCLFMVTSHMYCQLVGICGSGLAIFMTVAAFGTRSTQILTARAHQCGSLGSHRSCNTTTEQLMQEHRHICSKCF